MESVVASTSTFSNTASAIAWRPGDRGLRLQFLEVGSRLSLMEALGLLGMIGYVADGHHLAKLAPEESLWESRASIG